MRFGEPWLLDQLSCLQDRKSEPLGVTIKRLVAVSAAVAAIASGVTASALPTAKSAPSEVIYIRNEAPQFISDATIKNDIPAWTAATNQDFAPVWHTTKVKFVFIGRKSAPKGGIVADFVKSGPVKGALAYHTVQAGTPAIVVYAGTDDYYGYDNSVSFTHEVEELLGDPTITMTNQGYPYSSVWVNGVSKYQAPGTIWANELSDPVEAFHYTRPGANGKPVDISDFITPNWFNDQVNGGYDFMNLIQAPFTILKGGYAQFWDGVQWNVVENFRHAGRDAAGYLKGEKLERH